MPVSFQPCHLQPDILEVQCMFRLICAGTVPEGIVCLCASVFN